MSWKSILLGLLAFLVGLHFAIMASRRIKASHDAKAPFTKVENGRFMIQGHKFRITQCLWHATPDNLQFDSITRGSDGTIGGEVSFYQNGRLVTSCSVVPED